MGWVLVKNFFQTLIVITVSKYTFVLIKAHVLHNFLYPGATENNAKNAHQTEQCVLYL